MSRIRVLHVITKLELGGAQGNTLHTVSNLDRSRFETHLVTGRGGLLDAEALKIPDVSVTFCDDLEREIKPWSDWKAYRSLFDIFSRIKPDIVHTHSSKAGILGRFAAAKAGVPIIIHTYHGFGFHRFQNPWVFRCYVAAERAACRRTHHLVFVSKDNWKWADELKLTEGLQCSLIRSGIGVKQILATNGNGQIRRELGIPVNAKVTGMIACLKPQKDPATFVRASGILQKEMPDCHFLLVGDGELQPEISSCIQELPNPKNFHFLGWRRDIYEILRELDVLVLTSLWEGLPRVIPEAIVSGVPVVATDIDGNREILQDGRSGFLARARDPQDFAGKILRVLRENKRADSQHSREISEEFEIDDMISALQKLYTKLAART